MLRGAFVRKKRGPRKVRRSEAEIALASRTWAGTENTRRRACNPRSARRPLERGVMRDT